MVAIFRQCLPASAEPHH